MVEPFLSTYGFNIIFWGTFGISWIFGLPVLIHNLYHFMKQRHSNDQFVIVRGPIFTLIYVTILSLVIFGMIFLC